MNYCYYSNSNNCLEEEYTTFHVVSSIRKILYLITDLLSPGYILLSLVAIMSRYNNVLKMLSSHGKTSTTGTTTTTTSTKRMLTHSSFWFSFSSSRWFWISKRCFVHFYLTGLSSTAIVCYCYYYNNNNNSSKFIKNDEGGDTNNGTGRANDENENGNRIIIRQSSMLSLLMMSRIIMIVAIILLAVHLFRRSYECLFVQQYHKESSKMHIAGYALGLGYYLVLPLVFLDIDIENNNNNIDNDIEIKNNTIGGIAKIARNNNILGVESEGTSNKTHSFFFFYFDIRIIMFHLYLRDCQFVVTIRTIQTSYYIG